MNFLAIDVETANADCSSICQIGIAEFEDGQLINTWSTLINPEAYFDPFNTSIHGIKSIDVTDAPTFDQVYAELKEKLIGKVAVHHMPFDRTAICRACEEYQLEALTPLWLDSAKIVRRTWEQFAYKGYGLANIANYLKIEFNHHDALHDAIAAGKVVVEACKANQLTIEDWVERTGKPISPSSIKLDGNSEGPLYGENLVFTGALSLTRKEAATIAANLGCNVASSVTKTTTILVVGTHDSTKLAGYEKSSKHRKTEDYIQKGLPIKILSEKDFIEMCNAEDKELKLQVPLVDPIPTKRVKKEESQNKKDSKSLMVEINLVDLMADGLGEAQNLLNETLANLTEEQKEMLVKINEERQNLINSIQDCKHEEKRKLGNEFKSSLERIEKAYEQLEIEDFEEDDIDVILTIELEIDLLQDANLDLMKDKKALSEFFESLLDSTEQISDDLEEEVVPDNVKEYAEVALEELNKTIERIKDLANIKEA
jgi:DNA polymerase-3 subunit epsilon